MPKSLKPDSVVADCTKRLAWRYYQLKTGHARTGQHLHWAKVRLTAQCWWCERPSQTRDQPLQGVPGMEAAAKGAVGRGAEGDGKVEEPVEDTGPTCRQEVRKGSAGLPHRNGCGKAGATCGRTAPGARRQNGSSGSARSGKRNRRRRRRSWVLRQDRALGRNCRCSSPHPPSWHRQTRSRGGSLFLCHFPLWFLWCAPIFGTGLGGGRRGAGNVPPPRGLRTGKPGKMYAAMIYIGRMRV